MFFFSEFQVGQVTGGVNPTSPLGFLIISIGIIFTLGLPILMVWKGKKD